MTYRNRILEGLILFQLDSVGTQVNLLLSKSPKMGGTDLTPTYSSLLSANTIAPLLRIQTRKIFNII